MAEPNPTIGGQADLGDHIARPPQQMEQQAPGDHGLPRLPLLSLRPQADGVGEFDRALTPFLTRDNFYERPRAEQRRDISPLPLLPAGHAGRYPLDGYPLRACNPSPQAFASFLQPHGLAPYEGHQVVNDPELRAAFAQFIRMRAELAPPQDFIRTIDVFGRVAYLPRSAGNMDSDLPVSQGTFPHAQMGLPYAGYGRDPGGYDTATNSPYLGHPAARGTPTPTAYDLGTREIQNRVEPEIMRHGLQHQRGDLQSGPNRQRGPRSAEVQPAYQTFKSAQQETRAPKNQRDGVSQPAQPAPRTAVMNTASVPPRASVMSFTSVTPRAVVTSSAEVPLNAVQGPQHTAGRAPAQQGAAISLPIRPRAPATTTAADQTAFSDSHSAGKVNPAQSPAGQAAGNVNQHVGSISQALDEATMQTLVPNFMFGQALTLESLEMFLSVPENEKERARPYIQQLISVHQNPAESMQAREEAYNKHADLSNKIQRREYHYVKSKYEHKAVALYTALVNNDISPDQCEAARNELAQWTRAMTVEESDRVSLILKKRFGKDLTELGIPPRPQQAIMADATGAALDVVSGVISDVVPGAVSSGASGDASRATSGANIGGPNDHAVTGPENATPPSSPQGLTEQTAAERAAEWRRRMIEGQPGLAESRAATPVNKEKEKPKRGAKAKTKDTKESASGQSKTPVQPRIIAPFKGKLERGPVSPPSSQSLSREVKHFVPAHARMSSKVKDEGILLSTHPNLGPYIPALYDASYKDMTDIHQGTVDPYNAARVNIVQEKKVQESREAREKAVSERKKQLPKNQQGNGNDAASDAAKENQEKRKLDDDSVVISSIEASPEGSAAKKARME
ncbi:hypothetical protein GQ43DRAFT_315864 [Delitschia confertaspora ATCC 74209]|uniref:Uncharacterized protein n=1 Tax=Delitschia confertaspora ATCC 74209 TaxID=1513339 RepID=A0A9P4MWL2_9PLEO|nr:hypothetical protein GQ43DRAFT_315864 [Delitschia confertaspora ATCC 74209]